ncbi:MAG: EAL and GGDEF domain-containing protein [Desulfotalea sp.]
MNLLASSYKQKNQLKSIISGRKITTHFQPIVSRDHESVFAYEALCRLNVPNPFGNIEEMFQFSHKAGLTLSLDMCCRANALKLAAEQGINSTESYLFVNVCPTTLMHPGHFVGQTEKLCLENKIDKDRIVLEITEHEAVYNYDLFHKAIEHYRKGGFKIAIDDFGAGYGGLKMLSVVEPDYVKVDKHFLLNCSKSKTNATIMELLSTGCNSLGVAVIVEGVETDEHLDICREMNFDLMQGYHLGRPNPNLLNKEDIDLSKKLSINKTVSFREADCIGGIVSYVEPIQSDMKVTELLDVFNEDPSRLCIPVLHKNELCGLVNRQRFMENSMVGRLGHGLNINYYKTISNVLEKSFLQVPDYLSIEDVAQKIQRREKMAVYDDICVTKNGQYIGVVSVQSVLNSVTKNSIRNARGANPLTGLPGNEFILRQIEKMFSGATNFDVCYIDIDNFKPYNDCYGFNMGDKVIKALGNISDKVIKKWSKEDRIGFAGHIGGDDFILLTKSHGAAKISEEIIAQFEQILPLFHTREEYDSSYYYSTSRSGDKQQFPLLSLSVGVVSTINDGVCSVAEISSLATEVKKKAKAVVGSVVVWNDRVTV